MTDPTGTPGPQDADPVTPDVPGEIDAENEFEEELAPVHFPAIHPERAAAAQTAQTGSAPSGDGSSTGGSPTDDSQVAAAAHAFRSAWWSHLPWWAWTAIGVIVVAIIAIAVLLGMRSNGSTPTRTATAPTVTTTLAGPGPTANPVEHTAGSDLFVGLPGASAQFVLTAAAEHLPWVHDSNAVEAYALTYLGPSTASASSSDPVTESYAVVVGQWKKPAAATAFADSLVAAATPDATATTTTGDVTVAGAKVGTSTITIPADAAADGTAVWTNGTVVVQVTGPGTDLQRFFDGYGW